ncbi:hypothetical protein VdG1_03642 [Verticillium dahliae VDG1]|nr:hypothetical protein VdG1_03642 [Verticillium dahliae VDG1]
MQLTQQLGLMALASTASAFVVDVFSGERCTGQSQNVNVYDNTCAAWMIGYRSFRVKTYGSTPQRAYFCTGGACNNCNSWWAMARRYLAGSTRVMGFWMEDFFCLRPSKFF